MTITKLVPKKPEKIPKEGILWHDSAEVSFGLTFCFGKSFGVTLCIANEYGYI